MRRMSDSPWPEADDRLRALWAAGWTTLAIAARLGISKNSVIGRARRLGLPGRASPIKGAAPTKPRTPRAVRPASPKPARDTAPKPRPRPEPEVRAERPAIVAPVASPLPFRLAVIPPSRSCCWPIGEPRTPEFRFCEGVSVPGKSYCAEHCRIAYQTAPRTEAQEAAIPIIRAKWATRQGQSPRTLWGG